MKDVDYIRQAIEYVRAHSFVPGYTATDPESLGIALSHYFEYDGLKILETTYNALEDSNFHGENETIQKLIDELKA